MTMQTLERILQSAGLRGNGAENLSIQINQIHSDSRRIGPGDLFVAVKGGSYDGHDFITQAVQKGAFFVIAEKPISGNLTVPFILVPDTRKILAPLVSCAYDFPQKKLRGIGITGTNGKTTVSFIIQYLLNSVTKAGLIGTILYDDGRCQETASNTTPPPEKLFELLSRMVENKLKYYVMEVSSHALDQNRTHGLEFTSVVFTNLTQDHLDYHLSFENYYLSKRKLFVGEFEAGNQVVNVDDDYGRRLIQDLKGRQPVTFGIRNKADFMAENVKLSLTGLEFDLLHPSGRSHIKSKLLLLHNVYNLLAALTVIAQEGFDLETLAGTIESFPGVPGRLERVKNNLGFEVFVDYAHTPDGCRS